MFNLKQSMASALLAALVMAGAVGCSTSSDGGVEPQPVDESSIGYSYFGSAQLARGSSINTTIDKVAASSDLAVVSAPDGVKVSITDADDGTTRLEVAVSDDASPGAQAITFDIAGEPEPVVWTIEVTG